VDLNAKFTDFFAVAMMMSPDFEFGLVESGDQRVLRGLMRRAASVRRTEGNSTPDRDGQQSWEIDRPQRCTARASGLCVPDTCDVGS